MLDRYDMNSYNFKGMHIAMTTDLLFLLVISYIYYKNLLYVVLTYMLYIWGYELFNM